MPRNRSHSLIVKSGRPMNIKTPLCREFEKEVEMRMADHKRSIQDFVSHFDARRHYISAEYYMFTPRETLITKEGKISSRSNDTDSNKVFRDTIYRCIGLDDKLERDTRFFTPVSHDENHNVIVILKLERLECLENMSSAMLSTIEPQSENLMLSALL